MNDIIQSITEAENRASEIKAKALERATEISAAAEEKCARLAKECATDCKIMRETAVNNAVKDAEAQYDLTIEKKTAESRAYADALIKKSGPVAAEIAGRIVRGSC